LVALKVDPSHNKYLEFVDAKFDKVDWTIPPHNWIAAFDDPEI